MRDVSINDLIDLIVAEAADTEKRIEKIFEWRFSREIEAVKWILGFSATIGAALLVAYSKSEISLVWWQVFSLAMIPAITAAYGLVKLRAVRKLQREYIAAVKLTARLLKIRPFLQRYLA